ncbi:hypothetical protein CJI54_04905 [Bifidobacteriaceae bacterium NR026]|nr:hypothetical protein CJI54_04905 [Bifidobacteriaceae bacterium NR026]
MDADYKQLKNSEESNKSPTRVQQGQNSESMIRSVRNCPNLSEESEFIRKRSTIIRTISTRLDFEHVQDSRTTQFFSHAKSVAFLITGGKIWH